MMMMMMIEMLVMQGFFQRSLTRKNPYKCVVNEEADWNQAIKTCSHCRYKRCIAAGMSRDGRLCNNNSSYTMCDGLWGCCGWDTWAMPPKMVGWTIIQLTPTNNCSVYLLCQHVKFKKIATSCDISFNYLISILNFKFI